MNKKFKILTIALAVVTLLSFGGCSNIQDKIEQLRCEHEMNDGEITVQATCEDVGEKTLTCALCGYEETAIIPAVGHQWFNVNSVEPTCTIDGHGQGIQCVLCEEWLVGPFSVPALGHTNETILGYEPTCTEMGLTDGEKCAVCDTILKTQVEMPANGHAFELIKGSEPTCTKAGLTDFEICTICGIVPQAQEIIPKIECVLIDGVCQFCGTVDFSQVNPSTLSEVDIVLNEKVAGNWYRFYADCPEKMPPSAGIEISDGVKSFALFIMPYVIGTTDIKAYVMSSYAPMYSEDWNEIPFHTVLGDGYIDVYIPTSGEITYQTSFNGSNMTWNTDTVTISENLHISNIQINGGAFDGITIKRLVKE